MKSNLVEAAVFYAAMGYHVFPCKPCSKEPATKHGFMDATTDGQMIRKWWKDNPNYNVAIRTGTASGLLVIDVDGVDGQNTLAEWRRQGKQLGSTAAVKTGNGIHTYLKHPGTHIGNRVKAMPGIDVREEGGYVLAPPSIHPDSGETYRWLCTPEKAGLADTPKWLLDKLTRQHRTFTEPVEATIPEGSRNNALFSLARSLYRKGLDDNEVFTTLETANQNRCLPPLDTGELVQITTSAGSEKYERGELRLEQVSSSSSPKRNDSDDSLPMIRRFKDMTPPTGERDYIVEGILFAGFAGAVYGDGGSAKSMLMMHMSQCVARGEKWLGFNTTRTNVLYLDFELDEDEQSRRAYEVAAGMGYSEPPEGFFYISGAGYKSRNVFDLALEACRKNGIGMVVVDSLGYALNGDAEASRDVLTFFREVEGSFRREGISLLNVDHQSKGGNYQEKSIFGSVYKSNSVRSVLQVEPGERGDGYINLTLRHKKVNFGPLLEPFGANVQFADDEVRINVRELEAGELAGERTLNASDRVCKALEDGPMYPEDISEATSLELGTVKNSLTKLRKSGTVKNTGNKNNHGAFEVSLSSPIPRDDYSDDTFKLRAVK